MVVTRSQGEAAETEELRRAQEEEVRRERVRQQRELKQIEMERIRRLSLDPPASPSMRPSEIQDVAASTTAATATADPKPGPSTFEVRHRARSPVHSVCSHRSTTSVTTRLRLAELEAAEKLAAIKRKELELEADLIKKRLRVDEWLRTNPLAARNQEGLRDEPRRLRFDTARARSPTPTKSRSGIDQLAESLEKMARPRLRHTELPSFSGNVNEWLPFKAAMRDTTKLYNVSPAENLQRLRSCLKGEARDAVSALLYTATEPEVIMQTLEQCFGRPEVIIDRAIEDLKKMPKPGATAAELNSFAIKLQNVICVLKNIDRRGYLHNPLLTREVLDKLSPHIKARWCDYAYENEGASDPEIVLLSQFLMREADRALRYTYVASTTSSSISTARKETKPQTTYKKKSNIVYTVDGEARQKEKCPSCEQPHALPQCPAYKALTVDQRWDLVKDKKICFKCARSTHRRIRCKAKSCGVNECRRPHHATLHHEKKSEEDQTSTNTEAVLSVATEANLSKQRAVLLKMCPVIVIGPRGESKTYALFDEGATVTLIDEKLANDVGAKGPAQPLHLRGVNMSQNETESKLVKIMVRGENHGTPHELRARTVRNLKLHQQSIPKDLMKKYEHLQDLEESKICYDMARPGILIGADHWECIVSRELRIGEPGQPAASRTLFGWVIHVTMPRSMIVQHEKVLHVYEYEKEQPDRQLHEMVEKHFRVEALGVALQPRVSDADQRAIAIVKKTIKKSNDGYEVGLPWRDDNITMPPTYDMAFRRLKTIEKKMDASPDFAKEYSTQIENLLKKGYAVPCDGSERASPVCWYLPHFAVRNPNKPGKVRLVFDAAAASQGVSLNNHLLEGPDLLLSLPGILFRFREKPIAVTADIQEMFLQVKIRREDQPAQQFLWRGNDRENPPRHYKMSSMIFGAASSPFMAHYVRNHNANLHGEKFPLALKAITRSHYMDDYVASYDNREEAKNAVKEVVEVHAAANFKLRGWSTNDTFVIEDVPAELRTTMPTQLGGTQPENKILELYWSAEKDEMGFNTSMNRVPAEVRVRKQTRTPTKREALGAVMSIYDPLGLLSQYTVRAKIILQSLWRLKTTWDEPLPAEEGELFSNWLSHLNEIEQLRLPRLYATPDYHYVELHIFCDASEQAYATVAYWRVTHEDGNVDITLVAAKAKVAPKRTQTIPRLELQAAVIGSRLADKELRAAYAEWAPILRDEGLLRRMEWRYIPPGAPNQGGVWERLVRSVKTALTATLHEKEPTEEILQTLLTEAEFSINSRPLTHVSVSLCDPEALTPNHFLLGSSMGLPSTGPCKEADRRTWRTSQVLADHFWQRWLNEYLPTLVPRGEPSNNRRPLRTGDVVVVADHTLPRNTWPMGIVEQTYQGPDGGVRVADVRTRTGVFKRPTSKLVVLKSMEASRAAPGGEM